MSAMTDPSDEFAMRLRGIEVGFGSRTIIKGLDLDVRRGEILGFVGASGTGKSVLMRTVLGLVKKQAGTVELLDAPYDRLPPRERVEIDKRIGVLFQHGALFSSLDVKHNIQVPMREYLSLSGAAMDALAAIKLAMVGLKPEAAQRLPSELSGGMIKRAALARALALDPDIVFLDEPTSGLDPIGSAAFDALIVDLRNALGLTVFMVTHDLDSLFSVCDRIAVLGEGRILVIGTLDEVRQYDHPWVREYFIEGRAAARRI
ncbi:MAG: ATP-binding cassette domain-containing protein [Hyphomicrobiaceae bacterium]|nr:ATP-binding cassette domain-containing protein [Hyphomicrobiaceae bacterium]